MASFTPVDVVRLAIGSRLRVPDVDLQPVADTLTIHLASAAPILRVDLSDVNSAPVFSIGFITKAKKLSINDHLDLAGLKKDLAATVVACGGSWLSLEVHYECRRRLREHGQFGHRDRSGLGRFARLPVR